MNICEGGKEKNHNSQFACVESEYEKQMNMGKREKKYFVGKEEKLRELFEDSNK